jgi:hypothetical protein
MGGVHACGNATILSSSTQSRPLNCRCSYNGGHDCLTIAEKRASKGHLEYIATRLQTEIRSVSKTRNEDLLTGRLGRHLTPRCSLNGLRLGLDLVYIQRWRQ